MGAKVEKRSHERKSTHNSSYPVVWFVVKSDITASGEVKASVTDISESGVGLFTDVALAPGQMIKFTNKESRKDLPEVGVVMWTTESKEGYKAGVMF
jgi:hypothetical protein